MENKTVTYDRNGLIVGGRRSVPLCASLFYFRIPRASWSTRIDDLLSTGYDTADVYFPWNYHAVEKGKYDFTGERDAAAFLALCAEKGLNVVARFGPYICSEWNGGGLPAWVTHECEKIRTTDPQYLEYVREWYDEIVPLVAGFQYDRGGSVILAQLENELDFYDCDDADGYIGFLYDTARALGMTVPLFCCAGQSNVRNAGGGAEAF